MCNMLLHSPVVSQAQQGLAMFLYDYGLGVTAGEWTGVPAAEDGGSARLYLCLCMQQGE